MTKEEAKAYLTELGAEEFFKKLNTIKKDDAKDWIFISALHFFLEGEIDLVTALNSEVPESRKKWIDDNAHKSSFQSRAKEYFIEGKNVDLSTLGKAMDIMEIPSEITIIPDGVYQDKTGIMHMVVENSKERITTCLMGDVAAVYKYAIEKNVIIMRSISDGTSLLDFITINSDPISFKLKADNITFAYLYPLTDEALSKLGIE